nr:type I toxin-antitoxin system toxin Ldr family protein [Escherichia coli]
MTLAELGMAFWHDLAAPVIAGTTTLIGRVCKRSDALS